MTERGERPPEHLKTPPGWFGARYVTDREILTSWRNGLNTAEIAAKFFVPEATVANRLPRVLQMARELHMDEWM